MVGRVTDDQAKVDVQSPGWQVENECSSTSAASFDLCIDDRAGSVIRTQMAERAGAELSGRGLTCTSQSRGRVRRDEDVGNDGRKGQMDDVKRMDDRMGGIDGPRNRGCRRREDVN